MQDFLLRNQNKYYHLIYWENPRGKTTLAFCECTHLHALLLYWLFDKNPSWINVYCILMTVQIFCGPAV
jgi:hypothetical protein